MKIFYIFLILIFTLGCSFDKKTGIWKDSSNLIKKKDILYKGFEQVKISSNIFFNEIVDLDNNFKFLIPPLIKNEKWNDIFFSDGNVYKNFLYNDTNKIILKSKKLSRYNINNKILYANNRVVLNDSKGNIIIYSIQDEKIINKFNFYKKKYKKLEKKLNLLIEKNILYISDNLGYLYSYDILTNKVIWAKKFEVPFRSNIKINNNYIFLGDQNNNLFIVNKLSGVKIKQIPTEEILIKNSYKNNLSLGGGDLFFLNTFGSIFSINLANLKINWVLNINSTLDLSLFNLFNAKNVKFSNNKLIVSTNNNLSVIDSKTGSYILKLPITAISQPLVFNDYIFLVNENNLLICLNLSTGDIIYSISIDQQIAKFLNTKKQKVIINSINFINNKIYLYLKNSYVVKFNIGGTIEDIIKLPSKIKSDPIFVSSSILYVNKNNKLFILD